jgi:hypothetical protein
MRDTVLAPRPFNSIIPNSHEELYGSREFRLPLLGAPLLPVIVVSPSGNIPAGRNDAGVW